MGELKKLMKMTKDELLMKKVRRQVKQLEKKYKGKLKDLRNRIEIGVEDLLKEETNVEHLLNLYVEFDSYNLTLDALIDLENDLLSN